MLKCVNNFCFFDYGFNGFGYLWIGKECVYWLSLERFVVVDNVLKN